MNERLLEALNTAFGSLQDLEVVLGVEYTMTKDLRYIHARINLEGLYDTLLTLQRNVEYKGEKKDA